MGMVRFDQIARECRETFKGSFEGKPIVGLEHIEPYDMLLKNYDVDVETTFTKSFKKGQILFGRRRAYQHKACVATCDGICSGDITVIEPIEDAVYPDLLPFIIQNDDFFEHAIKGSNGALSPRVKWEHMANFEVDLPSIYEQKVLAEKLWAAYEVKQSYLKMIDATDEMVKAQFVEMFGTLTEPKVSISKLIDVVLCSGQYGSNTSAVEYIDGTPRYIRITDINEDGSLNDDIKSAEMYDNKYLLSLNDMVFARTGATVGKTYLHERGDAIYAGYLIKYQAKNDVIRAKYLMAYTHTGTYYNWVNNTQKIGAQPNISATQYDNMPILLPSIEQQDSFLKISIQADKSKAELRKSIDAIDKVIKSLINENL